MSRSPLLACEGLPDFAAMTPEQVDAAIPQLLGELNAELDQLEAALQQRADVELAWAELMDPLHHLGERLRWSWGVVSHLNGVCNTPELREAHQRQQQGVVAFGSRAGQSRVIYEALRRLARQHDDGSQLLDGTQQRILAAELRDMELRGVGLEGAEQEAFNASTAELARLASDFGNHVLDATNGWTLRLSDR